MFGWASSASGRLGISCGSAAQILLPCPTKVSWCQFLHVPHAPLPPSSGVELDVVLQRASGVSTRKVYHPAILGPLRSIVSRVNELNDVLMVHLQPNQLVA